MRGTSTAGWQINSQGLRQASAPRRALRPLRPRYGTKIVILGNHEANAPETQSPVEGPYYGYQVIFRMDIGFYYALLKSVHRIQVTESIPVGLGARGRDERRLACVGL